MLLASYFRPLLPFILVWGLLLLSTSFAQMGLVNGLGQLVLFGLVVCLPLWRTGRLSYVDIGWPWGLVLLAAVAMLFATGDWLRTMLAAGLLVVVGLRMGIGILKLWKLGRLDKELPRYQYQRVRWARQGKHNVSLALQIDAISQGMANASFLALPIFLLVSNSSAEIVWVEWLGLGLCLWALVMESVADYQKVNFLRRMKRQGQHRQVCDVGLWRFSRHPNYFYEWMVWNGLILAALPSWWRLQGSEHLLVWGLLGASLFYTSRVMYRTLVHTTGAVPAEYYSLQKRPDYAAYMARTNRFFPGPTKPLPEV